jgi:hypothetical protein
MKKGPQECTPWILCRPSPACRAERLAGWTTNDQINLTWLKPGGVQYIGRIKRSNILLKHL